MKILLLLLLALGLISFGCCCMTTDGYGDYGYDDYGYDDGDYYYQAGDLEVSASAN